MNRIQQIFRDKWAMGEADYYSLASIILSAVKAGHLNEAEEILAKRTVKVYASGINLADEFDMDDPELPFDSVAVIQLCGTLYSWETRYLQHCLMEAINNDRIIGVILSINGPGGMVSGLDSAASMIESSPKPIMAYVTGQCASAHYWIASVCQKRFLASKMSEVGSIGVVGVYISEKKYLEELGIDYREIYPDTADLKNHEHREIEENNNEEPFKERLEKIHGFFCETVAKGLGIPYDKESPIFRGATFMGDEAIEAKLADGYATLEDVAKQVMAASMMQKAFSFT